PQSLALFPYTTLFRSDDIENRIAELFQQRITQPNGVIRKAEVEEIISIMGQPEDYIIDDNANTNAYSTSNETNSQDNKRVRKLRSEEHTSELQSRENL